MKNDKINLFENITIYRGNRPSNLSKYTSPIETNNSIPYPTQTDINKVRWTIESCRKFFLTDLGYNFTPSFKGDLLVTGSCDIGNIVELKLDKAYIDDKFIRITPNNNINKKFLKYFLTYHKKNILNLGVGSTFKCFYLEPFKKWLINQNIPNIVLQEKIAHFFTLLDKQIDLWVQKLQLLEVDNPNFL